MSVVAAAVIGSSIIGAVSGSKANKKALKSQERGQDQAIAATKEAAAQARKDAIPLYQSSQQNALKGFQGALDIFGQTVPAQMESFQAGNVGAQNSLLAGLGQQQAAILGQPMDPNAMQAQTLQMPDFAMFQPEMPDFTSIDESLGINQPQQVDTPLNQFRGPGNWGRGGNGGRGGIGGRSGRFGNTRKLF